MPLSPGTRLGTFEIVGPLGAGGMGEVYRAHDTRLKRTVAIKALPDGVAADADRLARFEREARVLASLSHANIAAIHGIEDVDGVPHLVLEYVEGETLESRLARGPLPTVDALSVCTQIAAALEAAHERGIVHRDLKPANVMLTRSGGVKVLDFGLATYAAPSATASILATATMHATRDGRILGTAPYMSPEQARGTEVDGRTDVWAFGCVLYECLAGRRAFTGATLSDLLVQILERDPDWSALPARVPERVRDVLRRCLTKNTKERPRDIGDIGRQLSFAATQQILPAAPAVAVDRPSLAVLYFENLSSESDSEYFCAGITEDILTDLSKIKGLRVASRNAVARYRGQSVDIAHVGAELNVRAVLEGSVRRAGNRVRITAQLINASDGFHLWADRYDRTLEDVFAVQEEIASAIAEALRVALTPAEQANLVANRPKDVRAYDLYLHGRERYGHYTESTLREALDLFQQALAIDPDYALAWAGVADCHAKLAAWKMTQNSADSLRTGLEAARRAIAINPHLAEGHKAEALLLEFMGDFDGTEVSLQRALEANPDHVPALVNLAGMRMRRADIAGAERLIRRAITLDARDETVLAKCWLLLLYLLTDRLDDAFDLSEQLREADVSLHEGYGVRARVLLTRGDVAGAERVLDEGEAEGGDEEHVLTVRAAIAAQAGRAEEARRLLQRLDGPEVLKTGASWTAGVVWLQLGEPERAREVLGRGILGYMSGVVARLSLPLHGVLDLPPYAPRRLAATLVWPLEAPDVGDARRAVFQDVRIESGLPGEHGS